MKNADSKAYSIYRIWSAFAVGILFLLVNCSTAFAYDDNYMGDGRYWADKGEYVNYDKNGAKGQLKYYVDASEGCAYFYLTLYDKNLPEKAEDFYLTFRISNSSNEYVFSVNTKGTTAEAEYHIEDNFDIYYDFTGLNSKYKGGEVFVAFVFKNAIDRKLNNEIVCEYLGGSNFDIIGGIGVDMLVTTTAKTTTQKTTTQKSTALKTTAETAATEKTTKATTEKSTKFQAADRTETTKATTKKTTAAKNTTKFTPSSEKAEASAKSSTKFSPRENAETEEMTARSGEGTYLSEQSTAVYANGSDNSSEESNGALSEVTESSHMSRDSKILLAAGMVIFLSGVAFILCGELKGKYRLVRTDDDNGSDKIGTGKK